MDLGKEKYFLFSFFFLKMYLWFLFCPWSKWYRILPPPFQNSILNSTTPKQFTNISYRNWKKSPRKRKCASSCNHVFHEENSTSRNYIPKRLNHKVYMLRVKLSLTPGFFWYYWLESVCIGTSNINESSFFFSFLPGLHLWLIRRWKAPDPLPNSWAIQSAFAITLNLLILKYFLMLLFIHLLCAI